MTLALQLPDVTPRAWRARCRRAAALATLAVTAACARSATPVTAPAPIPAPPEAPAATAGATAPRPALDAPELMVPVEGVDPAQVPDGFSAPRSGDRVHRAVDILAPRGTPVLAAVDGRVYKVGSNALGGLTVYMLDHSERWIHYYAHLDRYRAGLVEGMRLAQGEIIGYVGTTGNAPPNTPHLHFQVMRFRKDGKYWDGEPVDPKPHFTRLGQRR